MKDSTKQFVKDQLSATIVARIDAAFKKAGLDKIDRKFGIFPQTTPEELEKLSAGERNAKFIQALYRGNVPAMAELCRKSQNTLLGEDGAYFVPEEFSSEILRALPVYGVARQLATIIPMTKQVLNVNATQSEPSVSWDNETASATAAKMTFGKRTLQVHKLQALNAESNELLADATPAIVEMVIIPAFAEALAKEEDNQFFNGGKKGSAISNGPFTGILYDEDILTVSLASTTFDGIYTNAIVDMTTGIATNLTEGALFVMHRRTIGWLRKLNDTQGRPILVAGNAGLPTTLLGYPVVLAEKMTDTGIAAGWVGAGVTAPMLAFGNFKKACWIGERAGMTIDRSTDATINDSSGTEIKLFEQDMSALRVKERIAIQTVKPQLLVNLYTNQ